MKTDRGFKCKKEKVKTVWTRTIFRKSLSSRKSRELLRYITFDINGDEMSLLQFSDSSLLKQVQMRRSFIVSTFNLGPLNSEFRHGTLCCDTVENCTKPLFTLGMTEVTLILWHRIKNVPFLRGPSLVTDIILFILSDECTSYKHDKEPRVSLDYLIFVVKKQDSDLKIFLRTNTRPLWDFFSILFLPV